MATFYSSCQPGARPVLDHVVLGRSEPANARRRAIGPQNAVAPPGVARSAPDLVQRSLFASSRNAEYCRDSHDRGQQAE